MALVLGFILGYLFGIANGPLDMEEIGDAWGDIVNSKETREFVAGTVLIIRKLFRQGLSTLMAPR